MNKTTSNVLVAIVLGAGAMAAVSAFQGLQLDQIDWKALLGVEASKPAYSFEEPSGKLKEFAEAMAEELTPENAKDCATLWLGIAEVLVDDDEIVKTTAHIRVANNWSGYLTFANREPPSRGASTLLDEELIKALGTETKALDMDLRLKAADVFKAAAWGASIANK